MREVQIYRPILSFNKGNKNVDRKISVLGKQYNKNYFLKIILLNLAVMPKNDFLK